MNIAVIAGNNNHGGVVFMIKERNTNSFKKNKSVKKNTGFYIALAICIVSVAAAAWTTYGSVVEYSSTGESTESSELQAGNDVSGEKYEQENSDMVTQSSLEEESSDVGSDDTASESTADTATQANTEAEEKKLSQPIENGRVIKKYSPDDPLFSKTTSDWRIHRGTDISAPEGGAVRSSTDGVVKSVEKSAMLGNTICIEYGDYDIYYCGLTESPVVSEGNNVSSGDTIGYVGIVPGELLDESHIHIEVKKGKDYVDPETIFPSEDE